MDVDSIMKAGGLNNVDIFYLIRSLSTVKLITGDVVKDLVNYLVKRGYDSDDYMAMTKSNSKYRRPVHMISLIADLAPTLKNKHFMNHVQAFTINCYKDMPILWTTMLMNSLQKFSNFKNEKLINELRKQTLGRQIENGSGKPIKNDGFGDFGPKDPGFFTDGFESDPEEEQFFQQAYTEKKRKRSFFDEEDDFTIDPEAEAEFGKHQTNN